MIDDIVRTDTSKVHSRWVAGFPISQASTTDLPRFVTERSRIRNEIGDSTWCGEMFAPGSQPHIVQIECVVSTPIIGWVTQIEAVTASSQHEKIVNETLEHIYALERMQQGRVAARKLMIFVETNFRKKNLTLTSSLLEKVKLNLLGMHALIGLTRSTLRARSGLPAWDAVYRRSRLAAAERGYSADELFVGMPRIEGVIKDDRANH